MATANSTITPWLHKASKLWCITKKGRRYYLGRTESEAKQRAKRYEKLMLRGLKIPDLGNDPTEGDDDRTVFYFRNVFLTAQKKRVESKDLSQRSFHDYQNSTRDFRDFVGSEMWVEDLKPEHFSTYRAEIATRRNLVSVGNEVTRIKTFFKWLYENEHVQTPVRFGTDFKRPKKRDVRIYRHRKGETIFTREDLLLLLDEFGVHYRAMGLLAINCAFKYRDCSDLRLDEVDLERGVIESLREKTGEFRVATHWPETVDALKLPLSRRFVPLAEHANRLLYFQQIRST